MGRLKKNTAASVHHNGFLIGGFGGSDFRVDPNELSISNGSTPKPANSPVHRRQVRPKTSSDGEA